MSLIVVSPCRASISVTQTQFPDCDVANIFLPVCVCVYVCVCEINKWERKPQLWPEVPPSLLPLCKSLWGPLYNSRATKTTQRLQWNTRMVCVCVCWIAKTETGAIVCHVRALLLEVEQTWKARLNNGIPQNLWEQSFNFRKKKKFLSLHIKAEDPDLSWGFNQHVNHCQFLNGYKIEEEQLNFLFVTVWWFVYSQIWV